MARRQYEPVVADAACDPRRRGLHDLLTFHAVDETAVGHLDHDLVVAVELVDFVERRTVRRTVARDRDRAADAREGRLRIVARPLAQRAAVGALDDDPVDADLGNPDAADRVPGVGPPL